MAGMVGTIPSAIVSANLRHSSPVFQSLFQFGLRGAAMNFCIPGLTSVGTGSDFAGTSRGASGESSAIATAGKAAKGAEATAASVSLVHLFSGMSVSFPYPRMGAVDFLRQVPAPKIKLSLLVHRHSTIYVLVV